MKRNDKTMEKKNSKAKENKLNLKWIISIILVLGIIVLLIYICVIRRVRNPAESQDPSSSTYTTNGNDTDMENDLEIRF